MARREIEIPLSRFGVLVAQLESIVASAHQQPPDALLCFDLLSELVSAIEEEPKESILQWQRKCENALYSLLVLGARRPVRRLASIAMGKVIAKGDGISIYSRASSLQGWLADGKRSEPLSCAGMAQCLGELYRLFGRRITSGLIETIHIAAKLMRFSEDFVRKDALQMLENALDGSGGHGAPTAYLEAFRIIMRVGVGDRSFIVKVGAARCLKSFATIGGPGLGINEHENSILCCLKALEDPVSAVRNAFSEALGALLALAMNPVAQVKQRGKGHAVPAKKLDDGLQKHLILPFTKASGVRAKDLRISLALSFVFFLQVVRLKYHAPDGELQDFALLAIDMLRGNAYENAHALACVLYILHVGVVDQMTEPTQRVFLVLLAKKLESAGYSPSVGVVILRILSYLLTTLGEVPIEFKDVLDDTIVAALSHSSLHVRIEAALTLRALAEVDPTCVGGLVSYGVTTLRALRETASSEKGNQLNLELHSLHGQATVLAALVSISPKLPLGFPARLPKTMFEVSKKMLTEYSRNPIVATVEKEAGWLLLASILASMPKEELEDQVFDVLLLWAGPLLGSEFHIMQTQDLTSEIRVLSAAIEALTAFIRSFICPTLASANGGALLQPVLAYLSGALSYISVLASKQMQDVRPALDLLIMKTLLAYESLSNPMAYKSDHPQILHICTAPFSDPSRCEQSTCLRFLLDKRDACLGPWVPGRDWFEDELRAFDGSRDGLMPCVWDDRLSSFPQPEPVSRMLVNQMLLFFGTIFASQDNGGRLVLLNMIDQCLKSGKKQAWHAASITNACVGLLSGLKAAALALRSQAWEVEILTSVQSIFQGILAEGEISSAQRRASAEGLGLLTRFGNDLFTAKMTRSLLGELSAATDVSYIGSIALSLGCIHRSAGGMALSTLVPSTVSSVSNLAKSSNPDIQLWSLHALLSTIEAAGLSYMSQVQATLFLAIEILLSEENGLVDLREEIGRLINAIVAVLGPELAPGSIFFSRCKSMIAEISPCEETTTLLESVRFTQQLVLFAPRAVSVHCHVQSLLPTLFSKQPSLRYLAVSTLRHLIEKDPVAMTDEKIEENLFSMLDEETDTEIGSLVRATITRLLYTSCPSVPSRWLAILSSLVLATSSGNSFSDSHTKAENDYMNNTAEGDTKLYYVEDDEGMIAGSSSEQTQESVSVCSTNSKRAKGLRYRTRIFAAECLSHVPTAVGTELAHFDLTFARKQPSKEFHGLGDWLVLHLEKLISLAFQMSTSPVEGMQPIGVRLLCIIMDKFDKVPDPDLSGHLLLEQYQAQLVSAVRSAITPSSGPLLLEAGLQLATKILTSSIVSGDRVALNRMFSLISRPLDDIRDLYYPSFAEWVACKIKIRLLTAHASIKCYAYSFLREQKGIPDEYLPLIPLFSSKSGILGKYWINILRDYCYICFGLHSNTKYKPFLDGIQSSLVSSKVKSCMNEAWPLMLQAVVLDSVPSTYELEKFSEQPVEDEPKVMFLSEYSMVKLESVEYQFLWGLALLVLFQGQEPAVSVQVKAPLTTLEKQHDGDYLVEETHTLTYYELALLVFRALSRELFLRQRFLTMELCKEILHVLTNIDHMANSKNGTALYVLSQILQCCPDDFFEVEDFIFVTIELCLKYLYATFQSDMAISKDSQDVLSILLITVEKIACRIGYKYQWKFIAACLSICYECYRGASTDLCISRVVSFQLKLVLILKKKYRDDIENNINGYVNRDTVLKAGASMLASISQDCRWRIHNLGNKINDSFKLMGKTLASCLEEVVALARLTFETQDLGEDNNRNMLRVFIYKHCMKCVQDTILDPNVQVQTIGLHVLKSIGQRELADGTHLDSRPFILSLFGELFEDILLIIQKSLKEFQSSNLIAATEECLRVLFLIHSLSLETECQQPITALLLEAIVMVFSVANEHQSQELNGIKAIATKLVAHLVQIPSSAVQIKDLMLLMPVLRRQQLQEVIRVSLTKGPVASVNQADIVPLQSKLVIPPPVNTPNEQLKFDRVENISASASGHEVVDGGKHEPAEVDGDDDDDDDWDAFQSLPVNSASDSTPDPNLDSTNSDTTTLLNTESHDNDNFLHGDESVFEGVRDERSPRADLIQGVDTLDGNPSMGDSDDVGTAEGKTSQHSKTDEKCQEDYGPCEPAEDSKELHATPAEKENKETVTGCTSDAYDNQASASQLFQEEEINEKDQDVQPEVGTGQDNRDTGSKDLLSSNQNHQECDAGLLHFEDTGSESKGETDVGDSSLAFDGSYTPPKVTTESDHQNVQNGATEST